MNTLKTGAPNLCSKEALFEMIVLSETKDGKCVRFRSQIMNNYLIVTDELAEDENQQRIHCLLYTSPSPRDATLSRMPSSA